MLTSQNKNQWTVLAIKKLKLNFEILRYTAYNVYLFCFYCFIILIQMLLYIYVYIYIEILTSCTTVIVLRNIFLLLLCLTLTSMLPFKLLGFDFSLKETLTLNPWQFYSRSYYICLRNKIYVSWANVIATSEFLT